MDWASMAMFIHNAAMDYNNLGMQIGNWIYQHREHRRSQSREDDAVSRRARDLAAAGINPLMAAGSAAAAMPAHRTEAPQMEFTGMLAALELMRTRKDMQVADENIELIKAHAKEATENALNIAADTSLIEARRAATTASIGREDAYYGIASSQLDIKRLEETRAAQSFEYELQEQRNIAARSGIDVELAKQKRILNNLDIQESQLNNAMQNIKAEFARRGYEIDLADKQTQLAINEVLLWTKERDAGILERSNFLTSQQFGTRPDNMFITVASQLVGMLFNKVPKTTITTQEPPAPTNYVPSSGRHPMTGNQNIQRR